jgi:uncharacterized repeat protein (TIGR03806 family)
VVGYDVNVSAYADGAQKRRFVFLPPGTRLRMTADRWDVPVGAYLIKTFSFPVDVRDPSRGERLVETRFLVKTSDGFTASTYLWNDAQTDAVASGGNLDVPVSWTDDRGALHEALYHVPGTSQCSTCHAGRALGWRSSQLDHEGSYPDGTRNQIAHFVALGLLDSPPPVHSTLSDPFGTASLEARARSYLDANCSHCHGRGGSAEDTGLFWDLDHTAAQTLATCRPARTIDGNDHVLVPHRPEESVFISRLRSSDPDVRMPPVASSSPDQAGIALLSAWVSSLAPTPCD